jgi:hypothetical protein
MEVWDDEIQLKSLPPLWVCAFRAFLAGFAGEMEELLTAGSANKQLQRSQKRSPVAKSATQLVRP